MYMKVGIRKPSIKKSIKTRTTGKIKRSVKKSVNPLYGKNGMGYINNPKKAVYNKVYRKTTVGVGDIMRFAICGRKKKRKTYAAKWNGPENIDKYCTNLKILSVFGLFIGLLTILFGIITTPLFTFAGLMLSVFSLVMILTNKERMKNIYESKKEV